jgi:DNA-binding NtrC family response regulator
MSGNRVLLVDDEAVLVELLRKYLERSGFQVTACTDPVAALRLVEADPRQFWLVLSDRTLPGIPGEELLRRIHALNPAMHAILTSGYPYQPPTPDVAFLLKPFLPKMLLEMIHRFPGAPSTPKTQPRGEAGGTAENR